MIITTIMDSKSTLMFNAEAFPHGAPDAACKTLKPGHGGEPSSQPSPFELQQDKLQVEAGDQIKGKYCPTTTSRARATIQALVAHFFS